MLEEERKMEEGGGVEYINTLFLAWQKEGEGKERK